MSKLFSAALAAVLVSATPVLAQTTAIMNARILTGAGETIENGDIIIRGDRIVQIGADLSAPAGARTIDATGKTVTPGIFAPVSSLGLEEIGLDAEGNDSGPVQGVGFPFGAALDAADAIRPASTLIPVNRSGGITRALAAPSPGDSLFGGNAVVIDLSGRPNSITKANAAQVVALGYAGAARSGDTRMGLWASFRETLDQARAYAANPNEYMRRNSDGRHQIADLKALGKVITGEQPLLAYVNGASDMRALIRVKNTYRLRVIIVGGSEAWQIAAELASANIPVILSPTVNLPSQFEDIGATLENAARLNAAGVKVAFTGTASGTHNMMALPQQAGIAVANGLPYDAAIAGLTRNPAEMFGLDNDLGTLATGNIADIVIWDGDPLELTSHPEAVYINGIAQNLENRQTILRERYRDLSRGDLPFAYRGGE